MSELRGVEVLQNEIEKSRGKLKSFNENIKKLTGYENPGPRARRILSGENPDYDARQGLGRGRGRLFGVAKRGLMEDGGPLAKRRVVGGAFSRLGPPPASARRREREESPYEDELPNKLSLQSSVVATSREAKNREEIMQEQTKDKEGMQRNRRMFGLLLGTLNKFKTESKTLESKEEQRKRIDKKLEENAEKEKKKFKQDTKQLMEEMHLEETRISRLEQKMEVVQEHAGWEREMKRLRNFICTKSKPQIFWLPRTMNSATESKLKESNRVVDEMLKVGQVRLEKEIQEVMERENKREERIKMRLKEDGLFQDEEEDKGGDERDERDTKGDINAQTGKSRESHRPDELVIIETESKSKQKRRVVIEENSDSDSQSEENPGVKHIKSEKQTRGGEDSERNETKGKKANNDVDTDKDDSESNSSGNEKDKRTVREKDASDVEENYSDDNKVVSSSKLKSKERSKSSKEGQRDNQEGVERIVRQRSSSRDGERPRKDRHHKEKESSKEKDSRKQSRDSKHGSRHSKRSRKESDRVVVKQEQEEKERKKKVAPQEAEESDSNDERVSENVKVSTSLLGDNGDVEMESERTVK